MCIKKREKIVQGRCCTEMAEKNCSDSVSRGRTVMALGVVQEEEEEEEVRLATVPKKPLGLLKQFQKNVQCEKFVNSLA